MSSLPVFFAEQLPCLGGETTLDGPEGWHAATVRRLRAGEGLVLTDGCGELAVCEVLDAGRDQLRLQVLRRQREPAPALRVTLAQALVKGPRGELSVELATEAGVDAVLPWRADRCVARWDEGPRGAKALSRWRQTAQRGGQTVPPGMVPRGGRASGHDRARATLRCRRGVPGAARERHRPAAHWWRCPRAGELVVVVGPEGGITDSELATLTAAGGRPVRLGSGILRSSSAGAVTLGAINALSQRWN